MHADSNQVFRDEVILDALESVNPLVKAEHPDFSLWRRLQENGGRSALQRSELSGPISKPEGGGGKSENPGWKLDKWKFLPMMNRTLYEYPDKKWFVFVETDTYVIWQILLQYLSNLDWTKQYYLSGQISIGDIEFAQGGNGFAASRPAMENLSQMFASNQDYWEDFVDNHWAGDCVLGKAFKDSGTPLLHAWPIFQGDPIGDMNYDKEDSDHRLWCGSTVSYHHIPPSVIKDMWHFEQKWIAETQKVRESTSTQCSWLIKSFQDASKFVRHLDMYAEYVLPRTTEPRRDWDNHSKTDQGPVDSLAACHEICLGIRSCLQYSLSYDMRCLTTERPNVGEPSRGIESGWIHDRMRDFFSDADRCSRGEGWIT